MAKNFSRDFKFVETGEGRESKIQELVFAGIAFLHSLPDFPAAGNTVERLRFAFETFKRGRLMRLEALTCRKDPDKAERLWERVAKSGASLTDLNDVVRLADGGSETLARAFTNRARLLQEQGRHRQALVSLEEALDCGCLSAEDRMRLWHKKAQCFSKTKHYSASVTCLDEALKLLDSAAAVLDEKQQSSFRTLFFESRQKLCRKKDREAAKEEGKALPTLPPSLSTKETADRGRFTVADPEGVGIACGSVIVEEDPLVALLNPDSAQDLFRYCSHCLLPCSSTLLPCEKCSAAVFCSRQCMEEALRTYHRYECRLNLSQVRCVDTADSYRIVLTARAFFQRPLLKVIGAGNAERDDDYRRLFDMVTHEADRSGEAATKYLVLAVLLFGLLEESGYLVDNSLENHHDADFETLRAVHKLMQIQDVNTHPILAPDAESDRGEVGLTKIGNAINTRIGSSFNHSCNPNTCRINCGKKTLLVATRNVKPGEEVTDIYSMHYSEIPSKKRREWLSDMFFFSCRCQACREDFPVYEELPASVDARVADKLRMIERMLREAVNNKDVDKSLLLHLKDVPTNRF